MVKVLDRIGPGAAEHGQYLKRHTAYIDRQGFEWLEDPKHLAAIIRNCCKMGAKLESSAGSKDLGRSDPEALDELVEVEAKLYQHTRVQWAIRHTVLFEKTERDDDETTKAGQSSTGQAGEISRGHAESHAQFRSSRAW